MNRMETSTNTPFFMHPFLPPKGSEALSTLQRGGLVLLPTANLWQVVAHPRYLMTIERQLQLCPPTFHNRPELLFHDLGLLKAWVPRLHPKLENLLLFHEKALTILLEVPTAPPSLRDEKDRVAVRLIRDAFCARLSEDVESPLVATLAQAVGDPSLPIRFGQIRSDVIKGVDYVVKRRQLENLDVAPAVTVCLDENDELYFVRD